ncbi:glycosyltransferase family 4 protein [Hymenobacter crusticola]|uniref:Glycosyltransferase subfamily 4-like N-terminal domain-containing protein n=1 Tax=Hymenobacter crusticola TaxID=1770526 RepID=A0A243W9K0_9BACT|nr:glycosyltransferase family 4 protein [Hymenobacter crusticola]OUJ71200.1 hypothetical protein BXP70_22220 [Hymenobacter crusticola]
MSQPVSIVVFATQYMPTGGIESHLREFCFHLAESGVAIDLVIANSVMPPEAEAFFRRICRRVYLGGNGRSNRRIYWLAWIAAKLGVRSYDALYTNGQGNSIGFFAKLLPRRGRWVHHHHTAGDADDRATWSNGYQQALRATDTVIACSRRNAVDIQAALGRPVQSIPCFSRQLLASAPKRGEKLRFGYYGRLIPEKGIDVLCRLSQDQALQHIEFHIWGDGEVYPPSFFEHYPRLCYHGAFAGRSELQKVLTNLDAYLLLSTNPEGLPIALLEVMSAGLPWLATDRGGVPDIACDPLATRVIPTASSYEEMKAAIAGLAEDIQQGKVSSDTQKALYAEMFSSPVLVTRWRATLGLDPATDPTAANAAPANAELVH